MNKHSHFILMSDYNRRMNRQIYQVVSELDKDEIHQDRGAYFTSIIGTLNHILVGDLIWLTRFSTHSERYHSLSLLAKFPKPKGLADIVFNDFPSLLLAREKIDDLVCTWVKDEVRESDFHQALMYSNTQGIESKRDFGELVSHLFNHQTHHRGQVSTLINQMNLDIGATDFLFEIPEMSL